MRPDQAAVFAAALCYVMAAASGFVDARVSLNLAVVYAAMAVANLGFSQL